LLIPETNDLVGGGKPGRLFLLDRASMALKQTFQGTVNDNSVVPPRPAATPENCTYGPDHYGRGSKYPDNQGETLCPHIHGGLVYWHGPEGDIARVYVWGERDYLRAYRYDVRQGQFVNSMGVPFKPDDDLKAHDHATHGNIRMQLRDPDKARIMPGGTLSLSANGNRAGSGIVWATMVLRENAEYKNVDGILRAFDALTLRELWNSGTDQRGPDFLGKHAKYAPVTIANGKVFVPTFSNRLVVYGLRSGLR
jgi:outer membrane protein assembly factor BamB